MGSPTHQLPLHGPGIPLHLPSSYLITFYYEKNGLKSIPLAYIRENGYKIETNHIPRIPYLEIVNKLCEVQ